MQTNIKPGQSMDDMMNNAPIKISDVSSMFRRQVAENERPFQKIVLTQNNALVDKWHDEVLSNIADPSGCVPVFRVNKCFEYFFEGIETTQLQKYKEYMPKYEPENVKFWINFLLTNKISEIHKAGITVISGAHATITGALRNHFAQKRWEVVYSKTNVPIEWDRLANDNPHLMHGRPLPFDLTEEKLKEMEEKIKIVLGNAIQPQ